MTRETELRAAIAKAVLPPRDFKIYMVLFDRAEWRTAEIDPRFQPRSLEELARWCAMSTSALAVGLNHLEHHKWIERNRWRTPGRGHRTRYKLMAGTDCDCRRDGRAEPLTDAERSRRYRARRKASGEPVTAGGKASGQSVTVPAGKASGIGVTADGKASGIGVTKRPAVSDDVAGQGHFSAKRVSDEGEGKRGSPESSVWDPPPGSNFEAANRR